MLKSTILEQINNIKSFNYEYIYGHERFLPFKEYSRLVISQLFEVPMKTYDDKHSWLGIEDKKKYYPVLMDSFIKWLAMYCETDVIPEGELLELALNCENKKIYGKLENEKVYARAVLDFISGMTDRFAIQVFNELLTY